MFKVSSAKIKNWIASHPLPFGQQKKKKVIIIDDSPLIKLQLSDIFSDLGFEVVATGSNGNEAVYFYKKFKPDFITLDILMPDKDGYEALTEILEFDKDAKAIMITAMGKNELLKKCIKAGATDYILKPFNPNMIIELFKNLLK